jgi:hypothetical protein
LIGEEHLPSPYSAAWPRQVKTHSLGHKKERKAFVRFTPVTMGKRGTKKGNDKDKYFNLAKSQVRCYLIWLQLRITHILFLGIPSTFCLQAHPVEQEI